MMGVFADSTIGRGAARSHSPRFTLGDIHGHVQRADNLACRVAQERRKRNERYPRSIGLLRTAS